MQMTGNFEEDGEMIARLRSENERLRKALEQVAITCTGNMDRDCNHRMALDFVRQVANHSLNSL